jgi:hypothetical protein
MSGEYLALRPFAIVRRPDDDGCDEPDDVTVVAYGLELPDRSAVVVWAGSDGGFGGVGQFTSPQRAVAVIERADPDGRVWLVPAGAASCDCGSSR